MTTAARPGADPIQLAEAQRRLEEKRRALGAPDCAPSRFPKVRGPHVAVTPDCDTRRDNETSEDDGYPRVPPGIYELAFQKADRIELWGRARFVCRFAVMDAGPHQGVMLPMFLLLPKNPSERPKRGWALSTCYVRATGLRPPKDLARRNPTSFLAGRVFSGRVVDVERDQHGAEVPTTARYSKVKCLLRPLTGGDMGEEKKP